MKLLGDPTAVYISDNNKTNTRVEIYISKGPYTPFPVYRREKILDTNTNFESSNIIPYVHIPTYIPLGNHHPSTPN